MRRTKLESEQTRRQILDAAEECFREKGITRTTLQMIAARAGCTRGAIYWHFSEKHDLLKEVIERAPFIFFQKRRSSAIAGSPSPGYVIACSVGLKTFKKTVISEMHSN